MKKKEVKAPKKVKASAAKKQKKAKAQVAAAVGKKKASAAKQNPAKADKKEPKPAKSDKKIVKAAKDVKKVAKPAKSKKKKVQQATVPAPEREHTLPVYPKAPADNIAPQPRQYAEKKFVPLTGPTDAGNAIDYTAYNTFSKQHGVLPVPAPRPGASMIMKLEDVLGQAAVEKITQSGTLVFHSVGDTGADKPSRVGDEADVAAMMAKDLNNAATGKTPAFFFHLGDVVYEFGQAGSYYAQFYEPYCMYNAPIFAIPGNHDGMIWEDDMITLQAFLNNFCAAVPGPAANASSLSRTTMNQPGVYFTLQAPYVSIIGLYSNVSDKGYGVISSMGDATSPVTDAQKDYLVSELKRLAPDRKNNKTAIILAVHHQAYTNTAETAPLTKVLDAAFAEAGIWPDVVLSGHAHNYSRYVRNIAGKQMPYIVAGCGGYNIDRYSPASNPDKTIPATLASNADLKCYVKSFGYLKVKVTADKLAIVFNCTEKAYGDAFDSIVIDLKSSALTECPKGEEPL